MITAVHTLIYSDDAEATRAFLRDVVGFPFVDDGGSGWLIFGTGPSEAGVHPTHSEWEGTVYESPRKHSISFMCDDIEKTMAELEAKGASFTGPVRDEGYGLATEIEVPGADPIQIYEPRHEIACKL